MKNQDWKKHHDEMRQRHAEMHRFHRDACCNGERSKKGIGFAVLLVIIGSLLLCTKLNLIPAKYIDAIVSWQMLLMIIGVISLVKKRIISALVFITIGAFFIIPEIGKVPDNFIGIVPENFIQMYWPVLLIMAGVLILIHWMLPSKCKKIKEKIEYAFDQKTVEGTAENGRVSKSVVFGASESIVLEPEFLGGDVSVVFGEIVIDLRKTNLPEGITTLDVDVVFGNVVVYVPDEWTVQLKSNSVFGAFEDKRKRKPEVHDTQRLLIVNASVVFAGGEII